MTLGELSTEVMYSLYAQRAYYGGKHLQTKSNAYSFGCSFAEVEVDIPLCKVKVLDLINVHDCGKLINPQLAEGQVHGGMSMAIGYALSEQLLYDEKTGKPLNNNLLDYKLSTTNVTLIWRLSLLKITSRQAHSEQRRWENLRLFPERRQ